MFSTKCHCGNVSITVDTLPETLTSCNCSICDRYGALWAYYEAKEMAVKNAEHPISTYKWGKKKITFHSCSNCGCVMYHSCVNDEGVLRVGVNARMSEPKLPKGISVRLFDGADTWRYLDN